MFGRIKASIASVRALVARQPALPFELRPIGSAAVPEHADGQVGAIALVADGTVAVSTDGGRTRLRVWSALDGRSVRAIDGGDHSLRAVVPTTDGRRCVTVSDGPPWVLRVLDLESGACVETVRGTDTRFMHVVLGPRDERAVVLSYLQPLPDPDHKQWSITVVDLRAPGRARAFDAMEETYSVGSVVVHPDGRRAFIGLDGIVEVWDLDARARLSALAESGWSPQLVLDAAGTRCLSGNRTGRVVVWDVATGVRTREIDVRAQYASVQLLPGEQRCVTLGLSGPPRVWDLETGALVHEVGVAPRIRSDVVFDRSGALMLQKRGDDVLEVSSMETGALLARLRSKERIGAFAIAIAADARVRVAVGRGKSVRFFELVARAGGSP